MKMMIWDWNGTLLNDAECCFNVLNKLCKERGCSELNSVEEYRRIFGFPVIGVYEKLGIDFTNETFEDISVEYTKLYRDTYKDYSLHDSAIEMLNMNHEEGIINILLSASQLDILKKQAHEYQCDAYFDDILGLDNIYAHSKVELAREFIAKTKISLQDIVWVGDTIHDYECANECGVKCILVAHGHQVKDILKISSAYVVDNLHEAIKISREI